MSVLVAAYRAWPWRPHCSAAGHVALCRWLGFDQAKQGDPGPSGLPRCAAMEDGPRCGGFDG